MELDGEDKQLIWVRGKRLYFCKWGWTEKLPICPPGKSVGRNTRRRNRLLPAHLPPVPQKMIR
ncbi:MAG TPA: hypothetical protein VGO54_16400, partial [Bradyrhizobium sp.]|nr:hypothetical protein [Bradyrhizobium sp.]